MSPLAIYTVITGNYDTINQPQVITPGADYYLFTNSHAIADAGVWKVVYLDESDSTDELNNVAKQDSVIDYKTDYVRVKNILLSGSMMIGLCIINERLGGKHDVQYVFEIGVFKIFSLEKVVTLRNII